MFKEIVILFYELDCDWFELIKYIASYMKVQ